MAVKHHKGFWTLENCIQDALKYKSKADWFYSRSGGYKAAFRKKWLKHCCTHMSRSVPPNKKWTLEKCKEDALLYVTRSDWAKNSSGYKKAALNGWLDKCCNHMISSRNSSQAESHLLSKIKEIYPDAVKKRFKKFELDIYIPSINLGIEFNGTYWHSFEGLKRGRPNWSEHELRNYHLIKRNFFKNHGIGIINVKEFSWKKNPQKVINNCLKRINKYSNNINNLTQNLNL